MQALICEQPTGYENLRLGDMPSPQAGPGEVLIEVKAAGMNFADSLMVAGKYQVKPEPPFVPGLELAGVVAGLGAGADGFAIGQRVMAVVDHGAFAPFAIARRADVFPIPDGLDFEEAAGFPIAYGTSYGALVWKARLQKGETLLVHGAAGGVGLTAVEIGKALGARVIATAGGADKCAIAAAHGADELIDYRAEDVRERVKALTAGRGVDVVYDPVGGDLFEASLRAVAWNARLVVIGFAAGKVQQIPANILLVKNVDVLGFYWGSYRRQAPGLMDDSFLALARMVQNGQLRPHVSHILPLDAWREGFETLLGRRSAGKIVLTP
jgi:NADPH2:quinone reductase